MKTLLSILNICGLLLLSSKLCWAQSGYNYARPDVVISGTASSTTGQRAAATGFPSTAPVIALTAGATASGTGTGPAINYPTTNIGFNTATPNPTTAFGTAGVVQPMQRAGVPLTVGTANFPTNLNSIPIRTQSGVPQRVATTPVAGIFGQQTYTGAGRIGTTNTAAATAAGFDADYNEGNENGGDFSAIPGIPGVNYPIYSQVPATNFDCSQQILPGYYADIEAQCQVFHICALNRTYSFLCPNGTIFSQETLVCVWWNQYDCNSAPTLYANNAFIYDYGVQGAPTMATQTIAVNTANVNRQQSNYQTVRTPTATNVYGQGFAAVSPTPIATLPQQTTAFPNVVATIPTAARFANTATIAAATFPTTAPTPFNAVTAAGVNRGQNLVVDAALTNAVNTASPAATNYPNAQITTATNNREYLPPRRP